MATGKIDVWKHRDASARVTHFAYAYACCGGLVGGDTVSVTDNVIEGASPASLRSLGRMLVERVARMEARRGRCKCGER